MKANFLLSITHANNKLIVTKANIYFVLICIIYWSVYSTHPTKFRSMMVGRQIRLYASYAGRILCKKWRLTLFLWTVTIPKGPGSIRLPFDKRQQFGFSVSLPFFVFHLLLSTSKLLADWQRLQLSFSFQSVTTVSLSDGNTAHSDLYSLQAVRPSGGRKSVTASVRSVARSQTLLIATHLRTARCNNSRQDGLSRASLKQFTDVVLN
jgi:hypothetical protein